MLEDRIGGSHMSGKNRSQRVYLYVESSRLKIPTGAYSVHIDNVTIKKGSLQFTGRIIDEISIRREEKYEDNEAKDSTDNKAGE